MTSEILWLTPQDPPDAFPDPARASADPPGLLAIGGDLSAERLEAAYRAGIFPWYNEGQPILWWSPDPRAVFLTGDLHISRRLRRRLRNGGFDFSVDQAFDAVVSDCAELRREGTWITPEMIEGYRELHMLGHAHSIEIWRADRLVGGLYGVNFGGVFCGESMYSRESDASKIALIVVARLCARMQIGLFDCQFLTGHLARMGAREISRPEYLERLTSLVQAPSPGPWPAGRRPAADLG